MPGGSPARTPSRNGGSRPMTSQSPTPYVAPFSIATITGRAHASSPSTHSSDWRRQQQQHGGKYSGRDVEEETEMLRYQVEKLSKKLKATTAALEEQRRETERHQISKDVIQQELVTTINDLRIAQEGSMRLQQQLQQARGHSAVASPKSPQPMLTHPSPSRQLMEAQHTISMLRSELSDAETQAREAFLSRPLPQTGICRRCESTRNELTAAAKSSDVCTQIIADLLKQRTALDRVVEVLMFGSDVPPPTDRIMTTLLSSEIVHTGTAEDVLSLIVALKEEAAVAAADSNPTAMSQLLARLERDDADVLDVSLRGHDPEERLQHGLSLTQERRARIRQARDKYHKK
eukprot:TRINITY_DN13876_c0_g1_i1.p1 TRINITY_DN13876_c0_g1~~TRINITY_DN13876_c0_g1_i1.p1  ORF type:complete len:347 (-),score=81.11 TRINITY_DN13876_c0_g1_i1:52-1092(-)